MKKIFLGADHAGYHLKENIKNYLTKEQIPFEDLGNFKYDKNDDYPLFAQKVALAVQKTASKGILICGSSLGISIVANKFKGIRSVSINNEEDARVSRRDNDSNVLCLAGGETIGNKIKIPNFNKVKRIIDIWLHTTMSSADRHLRRLKEISTIEKHNFR